jgi:hypothetical protein
MKKPLSGDAGGAQVLPGEERRRSQRVMIRVPVTLQMSVAGQKAALEGVTVSVNDHGALVQCSKTIAAGAKVELHNMRTGQKQACRVTRAAVESQQSYLIPVEFLSLAPGFWGISFPPTDWKPPDV